MSRLRIKEGAVAVFVLRQRNASTNPSGVKQTDLTNRLVQMISDLLQLVISDPDDARRPGTAITTLAARKLQTVPVPRLR